MPDATLLLHFEDEQALASRLAKTAGLHLERVERHVFPDGEIRLRLPPSLPPRVILLRSLHDPNTKLLELLLSAGTARDLGARHLTLVAPYLAYMRQDVAFGQVKPSARKSSAVIFPNSSTRSSRWTLTCTASPA